MFTAFLVKRVLNVSEETHGFDNEMAYCSKGEVRSPTSSFLHLSFVVSVEFIGFVISFA